MDPSGAIECRYRKYGQRSQILSLRDGPWHAKGSQFCPCVLMGVLVVYVVLVFSLLFVCAFFRNQLVVEGDDDGWWRKISISHGFELADSSDLTSGLPFLGRSSLCLS